MGGLWHLEERITPPENSLQQNDAVQLSPFYDLRNDCFYSTLNKTCSLSWRFIGKGVFVIVGEGGEEEEMRDEHQSRDRCHSWKAQQGPRNAVSLILTSPSTTRETFYVTVLLFLLLQYIITSLIKFPPLGKTWLRAWWGTCKNICVEELSAGSQIQGKVKLVLIGEQSDLARAACDFAAAQNPPILWSWKRTCSWALPFWQHMRSAGHPSPNLSSITP